TAIAVTFSGEMRQVIGLLAISTLITVGADAANAPPRRPQATARRSQLSGVRLRPARDGIQVLLVLNGPAAYKSTRSAQPPRITIDILETAISPLLTHREFLSEHAALIRVLLVRSPRMTRAILDLADAGPYNVYYSPGTSQIVVDIKVATRGAAASAKSTPVAAAPPPPVHADAAPSGAAPRIVPPEP